MSAPPISGLSASGKCPWCVTPPPWRVLTTTRIVHGRRLVAPRHRSQCDWRELMWTRRARTNPCVSPVPTPIQAARRDHRPECVRRRGDEHAGRSPVGRADLVPPMWAAARAGVGSGAGFATTNR